MWAYLSQVCLQSSLPKGYMLLIYHICKRITRLHKLMRVPDIFFIAGMSEWNGGPMTPVRSSPLSSAPILLLLSLPLKSHGNDDTGLQLRGMFLLTSLQEHTEAKERRY